MTCFYLGPYVIEVPLNRVRRNDQIVQLEPKIMQVLLRLAESHGQVVNKVELIRSVWADTFVSDDVLTRSISVLRRVLDDDSRQPRFIETLPRSGYRLMLIGPISFATEVAPAVGDGSPADSDVGKSDHFVRPITVVGAPPAVASTPAPVPATNEQTQPSRRRNALRWKLGAFAAVVMLAGAASIAFRYFDWIRWFPRPPVHSIAVLPLKNLSGNPADEYFADGITDELITNLAKISALRVTSYTSVSKAGSARESGGPRDFGGFGVLDGQESSSRRCWGNVGTRVRCGFPSSEGEPRISG